MIHLYPRLGMRIIKSQVAPDLHRRLQHLSVDLGRPMTALVREGVILLLRYHGLADGLPLPEPPTGKSPKKGGGQ